MEKIILEAEKRKEVGKSKVNALRKRGFIPAVIYGEDLGSIPIKVSRFKFLHLLREHPIETMVITLKLKDDNQTKEYPCMVKEMQQDFLKDEIIHIDFNQISLTEAIKVKVPIVPKGEPIGIKQEFGTLEHILREIEVECLATNIPEKIEVDVSHLKINDSLQVKDIDFSKENIKVLTPAETIIFIVKPPIKEEELVAPAEGEKLEPEVIKEKKETPEAEESKENNG